MYNVKHRFIFVEVPRTGTTSIGMALLANLPFDEQNRLRARSRHKPITVLQQVPYLQGFRSFGFCRNPFTRALSWFVHGRTDGAPLPSAEVRRRFTLRLGRLRARYAYPCFHFLSKDDQLAVDRVGRFERLHEDFADICGWLGIGELQLPHLHNSQFPAPCSDYYTPEARDLVLKHAAPDFEHFGYDTALA